VVLNGKWMDRAALDETLAQVEAAARKQHASDRSSRLAPAAVRAAH